MARDHLPTRRVRTLALTDKGRRALGLGPKPDRTTVGVPLLDLPWYDEHPTREGHDNDHTDEPRSAPVDPGERR